MYSNYTHSNSTHSSYNHQHDIIINKDICALDLISTCIFGMAQLKIGTIGNISMLWIPLSYWISSGIFQPISMVNASIGMRLNFNQMDSWNANGQSEYNPSEGTSCHICLWK